MSFTRKIHKGGKVYLAEVENRRINGKVVQKHIRYVGRQADDRVVLAASISDATVESVKRHGPLLVLNHLAEEIGLSSLLGKFGNEILSLVYAHCVDCKSVKQRTRRFERSDLAMILKLENVTEAKLLAALGSLEAANTVSLQRRIFASVAAKYDLGGSVKLDMKEYECAKRSLRVSCWLKSSMGKDRASQPITKDGVMEVTK